MLPNVFKKSPNVFKKVAKVFEKSPNVFEKSPNVFKKLPNVIFYNEMKDFPRFIKMSQKFEPCKWGFR